MIQCNYMNNGINKIWGWIILAIAIVAIVVLAVMVPRSEKFAERKANRLALDGAIDGSIGSGDIVSGLAQVNDVQIVIAESFPVQIFVTASGYLPDGCTKIDGVSDRRDGNTFYITVATINNGQDVCIEIAPRWEERFALDVFGLSAGEYVVDINGFKSSFTLDIDNKINYFPEGK